MPHFYVYSAFTPTRHHLFRDFRDFRSYHNLSKNEGVLIMTIDWAYMRKG